MMLLKVTHLISFVILAVPGIVAVTEIRSNLTQTIQSLDELSTFGAILTRFPGLLSNLTSTRGTLFAPTNTAIDTFVRESNVTLADLDLDLVTNLLSYHYLPLEFTTTTLSVRGGVIATTSLLADELANLGGAGNVLFASAYGTSGLDQESGRLHIFSGIGRPSGVVTANLVVDGGGVVHTVDRVFNFPRPCTKTAEVADLSTLLSALQKSELTTAADTTPKFTCFAPTNEAFAKAGVDLSTMSKEEVADAIKYHSIVGDVGYSTAFEDGGSYETLLGVNVTVTKRDGIMYINEVAVERANVIMTNGVAHVLSGVLTPPPSKGGDNQPSKSNSGSNSQPSQQGSSQSDSAATRLSAISWASVIFISFAVLTQLFTK